MKVPANVQQFLAAYPPQVQELAYQLRKLVMEAVPGSIEMVDTPAKVIGYGFGAGYKDLICTIMPGKAGVSLGIARGANLPDPRQLLEGSGKVHRHVKFQHLGDLRQPGVKPLLRAAVAAWKRRTRVGGEKTKS
jgi:hypothetical protein